MGGTLYLTIGVFVPPSRRVTPPPVPSPEKKPPLLKRVLARLQGLGLGHRDSWFHSDLMGREAEPAEAPRQAQPERAKRTRQPKLPIQPAPAAVEHLFDDYRLPVTPALKKRMKADVAELLPSDAQPSAAQWKLIFSDTPTTCVIAGAGAGKSTSLVLRVVLLHHYLGYELDALTVVTFTRESRKDFIKKLQQLFVLYGIKLTLDKAREVVRTFHARILPMVRSLPEFADAQAFESLNGNASGRASEGDSNPFDLRINDAQRQQLNRCYSQLLGSSPQFAKAISLLRLQALQLKPLPSEHPDVQKRMAATEMAARRDVQLCDIIQAEWVKAGAWPIQGIEPCRHTLQVNGQAFHVHGHIPELDAWVILGCDPSQDRQATREGAKLPIWAEWVVKRTLFQAFCDKPLIWLDNYQAGRRIPDAVAADAVSGPGFDYKVQGELASAPLLDAFVAAAGFIENLGLEVSRAVEQMNLADGHQDRCFFEALGLFWQALDSHLLQQSPPIMTYNRMFSLFGESNSHNLQRLSDDVLRSMSHLMIDEFQDVSPQIVSWVRACLGEVRRRTPAMQQGRNAQHSSLMCVGDDWQSIYGWRGSSPRYFMDFNQEFPAAHSTRVMLGENYRSHQYIIDAAEHVVRSAPAIKGKKARAIGPQAADPVPVQVLARNDDELAQRLAQHYQRGDSVLLLYRRGSDRAALAEHVKAVAEQDRALPAEQRRFRQMTYHSSKGLQADAVFMLGDCQHVTRSAYKNQLYRLAGLGKADDAEAFDNAQRDEALRLAYVAITRAVKHCYWYIDEPARESAALPKASDHVDPAKAFFVDNRSASRTA